MKFLKTILFLFVVGNFVFVSNIYAVEVNLGGWGFCYNDEDKSIDSSCKSYTAYEDFTCDPLEIAKYDFKTKIDCEYVRNVESKKLESEKQALLKSVEDQKSQVIDAERQAITSKVIPECALQDGKLTEACKDVTIFLYFAINIGRYLFAIVGSLTLAVFVYGGFMLILSQGNPEKVKKGTDALVGAVIGFIIVFSAYMLVNFVGQSIGLDSDLQLNNTISTE